MRMRRGWRKRACQGHQLLSPLPNPNPFSCPCLSRYRTLAAADNAVMLVDGAKGIEPQTRKLFQASSVPSWNSGAAARSEKEHEEAAEPGAAAAASRTLTLLSLSYRAPFLCSCTAQVARMRKLPIFTVVNKMDRPALNGFEIIEQLEAEFGLPSYPVNWPIGSGDRFCGVYHRPTNKVGRGEERGE